MGQLFLLQGAVLEVAHDRVQLGHGIAHGRARGEHHATPAGDLVQIAALAEHIAGFLGFAGGQSSDIPHFCGQKEVLVKMALVHKKPVNAQLFKGNYIVFTPIGAQFFQLGFQRFPGLFHLLDGEILACVDFQLVDGGKRFINLLLNDTFLPLKGQRKDGIHRRR